MNVRAFSRTVLIAALIGVLVGCGRPPLAAQPKTQGQKVLGPAVAGMFYPRSEEELAKTVDKLLAEAKSEHDREPAGTGLPACRL